MTGDIGPSVRRAVVENELRDYFHAKERLHRNHFDLVAWDIIGKAMDYKPKLFQMWVTKHVSRFCATEK